MTAAEKTELARFLDLAGDVLSGGYSRGQPDYNFSDDPASNNSDNTIPLQPGLPPETQGQHSKLDIIAAEIQKCRACALCKTRTQAVPGQGVNNPLVMVIGKAPGIPEDSQGHPFAGITGERLDKMLASIGLSRNSNCFLSGITKCRTPDEREPLPEETIACSSYLHREIQALHPKIILCAGRIAAQSLLRTTETTDTLRGTITKVRIADTVFPVIVSYHPDDLWENEELKRPAWEDLKKLKTWLDAHTQCRAEED